ncbi:uncharacterized protein C8A04DRAFT_10903 [Dichotomopilus funicola]|uniref:Uncharacterized protein n=1 Tax=Dichotomopilus funicola TaxID=1934379 RepID=A0AAN6ZPF4_9PEZI|nr:hypothetical protein C8A04DRAFT_10903 [Dichotomopilus funicola]
MNPNPLSDREKALEDQWIKQKECVSRGLLTQRRKQMAKDAAAKKQEAAKQTTQGQDQAGQK